MLDINTYASANIGTKEKILDLSKTQVVERYRGKVYAGIYAGEATDIMQATSDPAARGQSWITPDNLDYTPTQDIRNKIKPLMKKQARFMFGVQPTIQIKPLDAKDKVKAEELRKFIDMVLKKNRFWSDTMKAFLNSTIKKRVLLRVEANPNAPIRIFYHDVDDFDFEVENGNYKNMQSVSVVSQDKDTMYEEKEKQIWYRHTYEMIDGKCILTKRTYNGIDELDKFTEEESDTNLDTLPAWVILNGGGLGDIYGESDVEDLISAQDQYNRKNSDLADAIRFGMFSPPVVTDATEATVNEISIAPNAIIPLVSLPDKQATATRLKSDIPVDATNSFLDRAVKDMYETLGIPLPEQIKDIASGKSLKFMYSDLVARCEEKWHDWEPAITELIEFIVQACGEFNCYSNWDKSWNDMEYTIVIKHNYPVPEDEMDKKTIAIKEVEGNVRSHKSYIRDFSDTEDENGEWTEILAENGEVTAASTDQFKTGLTQ